MNKKDSLGDRMKENYENISKHKLTRRMPIIIRNDGRAFHTFTKGLEKPFDDILIRTMWETTKELCKEIQGCKIGYVQSDEISLLLTDYDTLTTSAWFDNEIQKMVSISASIATLAFNKHFERIVKEEIDKNYKYMNEYYLHTLARIDKLKDLYTKKINTAMFDSRVFNIPKEEVNNYFVWRQQDATRNSIQMLGQHYFTHKELQNKSCNIIQEMLFQTHSINFNDVDTYLKRGACIVKEQYIVNDKTRTKWEVDKEIPIFSNETPYIEQHVYL